MVVERLRELYVLSCDSLFQVDAYPAAVTFSWYFNSSEHKEELKEERFTTNGLVSTLNFAPTTNQDYGTLYCLGENAVGHQAEPCTFKIVPTGKKIFWLHIVAFNVARKPFKKMSSSAPSSD